MSNELLLPRSTPAAQGVNAASIINFLDALDRNGHEMHSLMIVRRGSVVAAGWWAPHRADAPHVMFSVSKSFTSTAAGFAVAEGLLSVDDKVASFFPDKLPENPPDNLMAMTVRDLLTMSAGERTVDIAWRAKEIDDWVGAFLACPFEDKPGTRFAYNSGSTYMVSAIVQKVTGEKIVDYLKPRLFDPLGIPQPNWDTCPRGVNTGGWGLYATTETIAKFGLTYLNGGAFQGKQVIPKEWVDAATSRQIANGDDANNDGNQGYGYQIWRGRHNTYRADGMYGQFSVVIPDLDMVVATTGAIKDMGDVLGLMWEHLLPAVKEGGSAGFAEQALLENKLGSLTLAIPTGEFRSDAESRAFGREFKFSPNDELIDSVMFAADGNDIVIKFAADHAKHVIQAGRKTWADGITGLTFRAQEPFQKLAEYRIGAAAAWNGNELTVRIVYIETPYSIFLNFTFADGNAALEISQNVAPNGIERKPLTGIDVQ